MKNGPVKGPSYGEFLENDRFSDADLNSPATQGRVIPLIPDEYSTSAEARNKKGDSNRHEIDIDDLLETMEFPLESAIPASKRKTQRSNSGYILFSAEVRQRVTNENPNETFGTISKLVGAEWKNLPEETKTKFYDRAQAIVDKQKKFEARQAMQVPVGYMRVFCCRWDQCDYCIIPK